MSGSWSDALHHPGIRAVGLAWFLSLVSTFSLAVAALVYAYQQGGASLVAVYSVASTAPGIAFAPMLMSLGAKKGSRRVLQHTTATRATLIAAAAALATADMSPVLVVTCAALATCLGATFRPTQAALLPWLARTPGELTAANVAATVAENAAALSGPVLAGVLLVWSNAATTFAAAAAAMALATVALSRLEVPDDVRIRAGSVQAGLIQETAKGAGALVKLAPPAGVVVVALVQTFVRGALLVLMVVLALDVLRLGDSSVGWFNAAVGLGGLVGAVVAARTVRLTRLARSFIAGTLLWGVGVAALAFAPGPSTVFVALAVAGVGNAVQDAAAFTLLPRLLGPRVTGPALGALEVVILVGMGAGALTATTLAEAFGVRNSLLLLGGGLGLVALMYARVFARVDRGVRTPPVTADLLRALPMFAPLPIVVIEDVVDSLDERRFGPGTTVVAEGDPGNEYHLVTAGEVAVQVRGIKRRTLGPGDGFGEIALLRDVPRTATVTAITPLTTVSLERSAFLSAVSMCRSSRHQADLVADGWLAGDPEADARS